MTTDLSVNEKDLLSRVEDDENLRLIFFRKVKGLKWFDAFEKRGYFNPENNPKPVPAEEEGYVKISFWPIIDYLVQTAPELSDPKNLEYAKKYLKLIVDVTNYAKKNNYSNNRTWWQFAKIINFLPHEIINSEFIDNINFWLEDKYERGFVAQEVGEQWLPKLLELNDDHSLLLSKKLLETIYKVKFIDRKFLGSNKREASLRFDYYYAQKITGKVASLSGERLGRDAVQIFDRKLKEIINELDNDLWSSIWQPAIEPHDQNKYRNGVENILIQAYRDSLAGYIRNKQMEAYDYVNEMIQTNYQTIQRIAIHAITESYIIFRETVIKLLEKKYFECNFRHEMWNLLNRNYQNFSEPQRQKTLEIITGITREDDDENVHEGATSYNRAIWLAAIKDHGKTEADLYYKNIKIAKAEPEHPDFSSYTSSGWGGRESPFSLDDLQALSIEDLVQKFKNYKDSGKFDEPGLEGLIKTFKELIKKEPLKFYLHLNKFVNLDFAYIHEILEAYRDLWEEKTKLPWDDIWYELLNFCSLVIAQDRFWDPERSKQREPFVANPHWIVSSIGRLLVAGTKSDEHALNEKYHNDVEKLLSDILIREKGTEFDQTCDAVFTSINSPRGICIEALINLTLRSCRLSDKKNNKDHLEIWKHFQGYYDEELKPLKLENPEYEFATLVVMYLPNFLYMSKDWVLGNLAKIFNKDNYLKWLCAMQGYAYVSNVYQEIYQYLKEHGHFLKVLDDDKIKDKVENKIIENISIAFINNYETIGDENSLINTLILRNDFDEISHLIWFIWTLGKKEDNNLTKKVFELWKRILQNIDLSSKEGKKIASSLCQWSVFVKNIDENILEMILTVAPYADESHHSYHLLENLAENSKTQPFEAQVIWMKMLENSASDYPEKAVRQIFANLLREGNEGLHKARQVGDEYLKKGNDRPSLWLREIIQQIPKG